MVLATIAPPAGPLGPRHGPAAPAAAAAPHTLAVANAALRSGFVLLPRTILHAAGLSRDAKLLYAVLLSYAWQEGSCFPGYERLKADLGCGINQITKYLRELETVGLISRRRRGLGKTNVYTINDLPALAPRDAGRIHQSGETSVTVPVKAQPPFRRREQDSAKRDTEEQQTAIALAEGGTSVDVVALLLAQGVTKRIAKQLLAAHGNTAVRRQLEYASYRKTTKNPAGALVTAITEDWAPPEAFLEVRQREAARVSHEREAEQRACEAAAEDERRRQEVAVWEALSPEEKAEKHLPIWRLRVRTLEKREPTPEEAAARRAALIAEFSGQTEPSAPRPHPASMARWEQRPPRRATRSPALR